MIELKKITKRFKEHIIFDDFSITIDTGKMVAISGGSGSGKTTLLNMIGLLDEDYTGEIIIDCKNIKTNAHHRTMYFRNTLGYLFQNYALADNLSVSQNLNFALEYKTCKDKEQEKVNALLSVGLDPTTMLNKKVFMLSGGEQQRVALARLMIKPCEIILADEPTGSLDAKNRDEVLKILRQLNQQGKTIVIVTHDDVVKQSCDEIIKL